MRSIRRKMIVAAAALGMVLTVTALTGAAAGASTGVCRTDPTVTLSNGDVVQLWANIDDNISVVGNVSYVLHVPKGVTATNVAYDSTGYLESVAIADDNNNGNDYKLDTNVTMQDGSQVSVQAQAIRTNGKTVSRSGISGNTLQMPWN